MKRPTDRPTNNNTSNSNSNGNPIVVQQVNKDIQIPIDAAVWRTAADGRRPNRDDRRRSVQRQSSTGCWLVAVFVCNVLLIANLIVIYVLVQKTHPPTQPAVSSLSVSHDSKLNHLSGSHPHQDLSTKTTTTTTTTTASHNSTLCLTKGCVKAAAEIISRMDPNRDPCDDFYSYSCGNYLVGRSVPDDHYVRNLLQEIQDDVYLEMRRYLEEEINATVDGSAVHQIKLLYRSCMSDHRPNDDRRAISQMLALLNRTGGVWPLLEGRPNEGRRRVNQTTMGNQTTDENIDVLELNATNNREFEEDRDRNKYDIEFRLAQLYLLQVQPFFQLFVTAPNKNAQNYSLYLFTGSTVLESPYFLNASDDFASSQALRDYVGLQLDVARLLTGPRAAEWSDMETMDRLEEISTSVQLEAELANITRESGFDGNEGKDNETESMEEEMTAAPTETPSNQTLLHSLLPPFTNYTIDQLTEELPGINWTRFFNYVFQSANVTHRQVLIHSREYLQQLVKLVDEYTPRAVDNYLCWTLIARYMPYLGPQFRRLFAEFRSRVPEAASDSSAGDPAAGQSRIFLSRWKECVHVTCEGLDVPAVLLYLDHKRDLLERVESRVSNLITEIKSAFGRIVDRQSWLSSADELKEMAKNRTEEIESKIGVPSFLRLERQSVDRQYDDLEIDVEDVFVANVFRMSRHEALLEVKKLTQPVNSDAEWIFQPLVANAFYEPASNNIILPAGILRTPLVNLERPPHLDYATLAVVIGHEIAHAMDSNSRKLMTSGNGSLWLPEVVEEYKRRAKCFAEQFNEYQTSVGDNVNGNLTLEENICDFAGLQQALDAYHRRFPTEQDKPALPGLTELTPDQVFFIQYAQLWCEVATDDGLKRSLSDNHSPGQFRANGVLVNSRMFAETFDCKSGAKMNPVNKCRLWDADDRIGDGGDGDE